MTQTDDAAGANAVYCSTCGADIHAQAEICPECGTRQRSPPETSGDGTSLLAAAASTPVPGLGQMLNREFGRGLGFMIAFFGGFYILNTFVGGALNFLLFGVWGYAIYDAYKKPSGTSSASSSAPVWSDWAYRLFNASFDERKSDEYQDSQRGNTAGATETTGGTRASSGSTATTTADSGTANGDLDASNGEPSSPSMEPNTANVTSDRMPQTDSARADSGADADSEGTVGSTIPDDGVDDTGGGDSSDGYEDPDDDDTEDGDSKWSRDDSDRSWSRN